MTTDSDQPGGAGFGPTAETIGQDAPELSVGLNDVKLGGRVSGEPQERELPSGDRFVLFRLVVPRTSAGASKAAGRSRGRRSLVDTFDVVCWVTSLRRKASRFEEGDVVMVHGALRRRFWRSPSGLASRYEIEADEVRRLRRAVRRSA